MAYTYHDTENLRRSLALLGLTFLICAIEVIGSVVSGSLALLADAGHVLMDGLAIIVLVVRDWTRVRSMECARHIEEYGFWVNVGLLATTVGYIGYEAYERWSEPYEIASGTMLSIAALGAAGNWLQYRIHNGRHHHGHHRGIARSVGVHIMSDLSQSIGVIAGGIAIWLTGWIVIDLLISLGIALWISASTLFLVREHLRQTTNAAHP